VCLRVCVLGDSILVDPVTKAARVIFLRGSTNNLVCLATVYHSVSTRLSSRGFFIGFRSRYIFAPLFFVGTNKKNALQSVNVNDQTVFPGGLNSETKWVLFLPRREYVGPVRNLQFSRNTTVIAKRQPHAYPFLSAHDFGGKGMGPFIPSDVDPVLDVAIDSKIETHGREGEKKAK
jgi:hypothetical protein